jgi:hypothetical protein
MLGNKRDRNDDICKDFQDGKCKKGAKCDKEHKKLVMGIIFEEIEGEESIEGHFTRSKAPKKEEPEDSESESESEEEKPKKKKTVKKASNIKDKVKPKKDAKKKAKVTPKDDKVSKKKPKKEAKPKKAAIKKSEAKKADKTKKDKPKKTDKAKKDKPKKADKAKKEPKDKKPKKEKKYSMMTSKTTIQDEDCEQFLTSECPNTFCDKIHNFTLKFQEENNEEFARRYFTIHQDFTVLEPYLKKLYGNISLDLMFIVDCTGSMSSWISAVKNELNNIIDYIRDSNPHAQIRVSFVGYRDYDCTTEDSRYSIQDFSDNFDDVKKFISGVNASGGGDGPEDVAGGLYRGLQQNWSENSAKYAVVIMDYPCHGKKYHSCHDDYPDGDPAGHIPEDLIHEYGLKNITLYGVKITNQTDTMYEIFSKRYQEACGQPITIADLGHSTSQLGFMVAVAANSTLSSVTVNNISLKEFLNAMQKEVTVTHAEDNEFQTKFNHFFNRVNTLMVEQEEIIHKEETHKESVANEPNIPVELNLHINPDKPDWKKLEDGNVLEAICHNYYIKKDRHTNLSWKNPFIQHSQVKSKIAVSDEPFSSGAMRYAFYMKDITLDQKLVSKIPKTLNKRYHTLENLKRELEAITLCNHMAYDFNNRIVGSVPNTKLLLNFIHCYIYEILDEGHPYKYYSVENYIEGNYVKYNNNAGWIAQNVTDQTLIAQAFSHYSWQITRGYLMVVDLQGVGGHLTDPQLHCLNPKKFGDGNFGYVGMMKYFMTHHCNKYCKQLELIHPRQSYKIDINYKFFVDKYKKPDATTRQHTLCDLCREPYMALALDIYNNKKKCWENFCDGCNNKRKGSFKGASCSMCKKFFKSSAYVYKMKRTDFPDKCQKCTQENRNELRGEFYANNGDENDNIEIC